MSNPKEYIFRYSYTVIEDTTVTAKSYDDAVDIFLSGGGVKDEADHGPGDWECIQEPIEELQV